MRLNQCIQHQNWSTYMKKLWWDWTFNGYRMCPSFLSYFQLNIKYLITCMLWFGRQSVEKMILLTSKFLWQLLELPKRARTTKITRMRRIFVGKVFSNISHFLKLKIMILLLWIVCQCKIKWPKMIRLNFKKKSQKYSISLGKGFFKIKDMNIWAFRSGFYNGS